MPCIAAQLGCAITQRHFSIAPQHSKPSKRACFTLHCNAMQSYNEEPALCRLSCASHHSVTPCSTLQFMHSSFRSQEQRHTIKSLSALHDIEDGVSSDFISLCGIEAQLYVSSTHRNLRVRTHNYGQTLTRRPHSTCVVALLKDR